VARAIFGDRCSDSPALDRGLAVGRFGEWGELDLHGHSLITAHTMDIGLPVANRHAFDLEKLVQGFKSSLILDEIQNRFHIIRSQFQAHRSEQ